MARGATFASGPAATSLAVVATNDNDMNEGCHGFGDTPDQEREQGEK